MRLTAAPAACLKLTRTASLPATLRPLALKHPRRLPSLPLRAAVVMSSKANSAEDVPHAEAAWAWFNGMGAPKFWVAPMVDASELPFRELCRRHGATAAYTPMLHARLFNDTAAYRAEHFTTGPNDRPLLAQFCANDPQVLLEAAKRVEAHVDGVDINLGCPQRIASRGGYGAYLMENLPLVEKMVKTLATNLSVPVTVKIRRFPDLEKTIAYAAMLERAGASMVAIHGRTRDQRKINTEAGWHPACWDTIAAVKAALRVPVLANGNLRTLHDVEPCLQTTGCDGVLSAESLLVDPALFSPRRLLPGGEFTVKEGPNLLLEYLDLCDEYPVPYRIIKGHAFKLLRPWLSEFVDLRDALNRGAGVVDVSSLRGLTQEVIGRIEASGRDHPIPQISAKKLAKMEAEAAKAAAIAEQQREEEALKEIEAEEAEGSQAAKRQKHEEVVEEEEVREPAAACV
jgi:tRNA-dihydrouridine synthase 1